MIIEGLVNGLLRPWRQFKYTPFWGQGICLGFLVRASENGCRSWDEFSSIKVVVSVTILASDGRVIFIFLLLLLSTPGALTTVLLLFMFMSDALTTVLLFTSGALTSASLFSASSILQSFCPFSPCILNTSTCCLHRILGCSPSRDSLIGIAVDGGGYVFAGGGDHGFCFVLASLEEQFQLRHHLSKSFRELLGDALVNGLD